MTRWNALRPVLQIFLQSKHRRRLLNGSLLAIATVSCGMALLGLSGWFLTACYVAGLSSATAVVFDVFAPGAGVRLLSVLRTAARYGERVTTHDATLRVLAELRVKLFARFAQPDAALALRQRPARLLYRLTADIDALDAVYLRLLTPALALLASALLTGLALTIFLDWRSGLLVAAIVLAGGIACVAWCMRSGFVTSIRRSVAGEKIRSAAIDAMGGQTELLMTGAWQQQLARLRRAEQQQLQADLRTNRLDAHTAAAMAMVGHIACATALLCGAWLAQQGLLGAPLVALGTLMLLAALEPLVNIRRGATEAGRTLLAARRLAPTPAANGRNAPAPAAPKAGLAVDWQQASIAPTPHGAPLLKQLDLQVRHGEWVVLAGASGAGKSTLLSALAGELPCVQGQHQQVAAAYLPQRTELFQDTIAGNLRLGAADASDDALWQALAHVGLADKVRAMPQQLMTELGAQGAGLSGGESRRLAVARTLLHPAPLVLLDEPTEGLDCISAEAVMQAVARWQQQRSEQGAGSLLMASHLQREARHADRIVWIDQHGIAAQARKGSVLFEQLLQRLRPG